jgi:rubrerythrin
MMTKNREEVCPLCGHIYVVLDQYETEGHITTTYMCRHCGHVANETERKEDEIRI